MSSDAPDADRRGSQRIEVSWQVDCKTEDTFLFAAITNISEMGIFVRTDEPLAIGTLLRLKFTPSQGDAPFDLNGEVRWINEVNPFGENLNPGMGVMFINLQLSERERLVETVRTIAYLRGDPTN